MRTLDTRELDGLHALAARGGIARARALDDCVAEGPDQLMYIQGDEVIVLRDHGHDLLAFCEGEVGWVKRAALTYDPATGGPPQSPPQSPTSLASPSSPRSPISARSASPSRSPTLSPQDSAKTSFETPSLDTPRSDMPTTLLTAPSPPAGTAASVFRRESGPFELESPARGGAARASGVWRTGRMSTDSGDGYGGIGGLMLGPDSKQIAEPDEVEQIKDDDSPVSPTIRAPLDGVRTALSASASMTSLDPSRLNPTPVDGRASPMSIRSQHSTHSEASASGASSTGSWDIYGDYARDSMYGLARRMSAAAVANRHSKVARASRAPAEWHGLDGEDGGDREAAWAALNGAVAVGASADYDVQRARPKPPALTLARPASVSSEPATPTASTRSPAPDSATSLRTPVSPSDAEPVKPSAAELRRRLARNIVRSPSPQTASPSTVTIAFSPNSPLSPPVSSAHSTSDETAETVRAEPLIARIPSPAERRLVPFPLRAGSLPTLLASPIPADEPLTAPALAIPPPPEASPRLSPGLAQGAWTPRSPSSPHSVAATQHAHTALSTPEGQTKATLVGRVETDLLASKGPVPITFLVGGPETPGVLPSERKTNGPGMPAIGLGLPSGLTTPEPRFASSPVPSGAGTPPGSAKQQPGRFPPAPTRTLTAPTPGPPAAPALPSPAPSPAAVDSRSTSAASTPSSAPGLRPRSRSFSAAIARAVGRGKKDPPSLVIDTAAPPVPSLSSPTSVSAASAARRFTRAPSSGYSSDLEPPSFRASASSSTVNLPSTPSTDATPAPPFSALSVTRSITSSLGRPTPGRKASTPTSVVAARPLPAPVSYRDFADTVHADGMDFELVQPRRADFGHAADGAGSRPGSPASVAAPSSSTTAKRKPRPETDEWGFIKDKSPTPEIFQSRQAPGEVRAAEQKWLSIISSPLAPGSSPPKKVHKLVLDSGVPASLRGRVWAWLMSAQMSARVPGLYQELLGHDKGGSQAQIDRDVATVYTDHSIFAEADSAGQQDLRSLLRAYSNFAPAGYRREMAPLAGALLIHCVVEDAFWLLAGLVNGALKTYYAKDRQAARIDMRTFEALLAQTVPDVAKLLIDIGLETHAFLERWWMTLFIRCLPWPTVMRIFDAVISEGPRFLLVASLALLDVSRERLLGLPRTAPAVLAYLRAPPQDGLVLPENFMRACAGRAKAEDVKKVRAAVERELAAGA